MRRLLYIETILNTFIESDPKLLFLPPREQVGKVLDRLTTIAARSQIDPAFQELIKNELHELMFNREFLASWMRGDSPIYKLAENFGKHLNRANLDIPCETLPCQLGDVYMLEFPDGLVFEKDGDYHRSAIVSIGEYEPALKNTWRILTMVDMDSRRATPEGRTRMMNILTPDYDAAGKHKLTSSYSIFPIPNGKTFSEALRTTVGESPTVGWDLAQYCAKCLLYIHSAKPELKREEGSVTTTKKEKKLRVHNRNFCRFDTTVVGYGLHNRTFHVDSTQVSGFFRTYWVGSERTTPKVLWIDEHMRRFNQQLKEELRV